MCFAKFFDPIKVSSDIAVRCLPGTKCGLHGGAAEREVIGSDDDDGLSVISCACQQRFGDRCSYEQMMGYEERSYGLGVDGTSLAESIIKEFLRLPTA